jgi:hypothetical protein
MREMGRNAGRLAVRVQAMQGDDPTLLAGASLVDDRPFVRRPSTRDLRFVPCHFVVATRGLSPDKSPEQQPPELTGVKYGPNEATRIGFDLIVP